jgi:GAF domain-containing protein
MKTAPAGKGLAQSLREPSREHLGREAADYVHSWMGIPLKRKERVIGLLSLIHNEPNYFTSQHARMALAIANQAAVAIENARLYEQTQALKVVLARLVRTKKEEQKQTAVQKSTIEEEIVPLVCYTCF